MLRSIVFSFMVFLTLNVSSKCFAQTNEKVGLAVLDVDAIGISPIETRALSEKLRLFDFSTFGSANLKS